MFDTDFMIERRLRELSPEYSQIFKNVIFVMNTTLDRNKVYFPNFTDHTLRHVTFVLEFCNKLIGEENIFKLNVDELFILMVSCVLHDFGMSITDQEFNKIYKSIVTEEYLANHPNYTTREIIRDYHQDFGAMLIKKYYQMFDIPDEEYAYCIAQAVKGHRKADLFDKNNFDPNYKLKNGNRVCLPYLSALIRLADELDIAEDRNPTESYLEHSDVIHYKIHYAIKHLEFDKDGFKLDVESNSTDVLEECDKSINKLGNVLDYANKVIDELTPFSLKFKYIISEHRKPKKERIVILDTDAGTDDAIACSLISNLGDFTPTYIIASPGNACLNQAVKNVAILKKLFGFSGDIVVGTYPEDVPNKDEKNNFHGDDGLANITDELIQYLNLTDKDFIPKYTFDELVKKLETNVDIFYISIGPISTLGTLLNNDKIRDNMKHLYIMGGGFNEWNCSHNTEFNFSKSPSSVKRVLETNIPMTLFPLDLTNHQIINEKQIDELEHNGVNRFIIKLLRWNHRVNKIYNNIDGAVMHDSIPLLYLSNFGAFRVIPMKVMADNYGRTYEMNGGKATTVATSVEENLLLKNLIQAFGKLNNNSK